MIKKEDWLKLEIDDDTEAIVFIQQLLRQEQIEVDDDVVQYVLDIIDEFYTKQELLSKEVDEREMMAYIQKVVKKDGVFDLEDKVLMAIVEGEYQYGLSNGTYVED